MRGPGRAARRLKGRGGSALLAGVVAVVAAEGVAVSQGAAAYAANSPRVYACFSDRTDVLSYLKAGATCPSGSTKISWLVSGPRGPAGNRGAQGPQGERGAGGPQGAAGAQGPQGANGAAGPQGAQGASGALGPQGPAGTTGPQGPSGAPGAEGVRGTRGAHGPQGPQGNAGSSGAQGGAGAQGAVGPQGNPGAPGGPGPRGAPGPAGTTPGAPGATGNRGPQGAQPLGVGSGYTTAHTSQITVPASGATVATLSPGSGSYLLQGQVDLKVPGGHLGECFIGIKSSLGGFGIPAENSSAATHVAPLEMQGLAHLPAGRHFIEHCEISGGTGTALQEQLTATRVATGTVTLGSSSRAQRARNRFTSRATRTRASQR